MGKKILFVASTRAHICHFHLPYLRQLHQEGWAVDAACGGTAGEIPHTDRVLHLPFQKKMLSPGNFRAAAILKKHLLHEDYAAIIVHTSLAAFFTRLAVLGRKQRPRVINMVHGYLFDRHTPPVKRWILLSAEKLVAPVTDLLITMNRCDYEIARHHALGREIATAPGVGVDFSALTGQENEPQRLRQSLGIPPEDYVLIYPAEFSRRKQHHILLRAMTRLPSNTVLVLPGTGDGLKKCQQLSRKLGIEDRVRFPGYMQQMLSFYKLSNAAVFPSRSEGLPFGVMEAMALGLPVVVSQTKGHEDLVIHGQTGLLYPFDDPATCAARIRQLMDDAALAHTLAAAAQKSIDQYSLPRVMPRVMELYRSQLSENP